MNNWLHGSVLLAIAVSAALYAAGCPRQSERFPGNGGTVLSLKDKISAILQARIYVADTDSPRTESSESRGLPRIRSGSFDLRVGRDGPNLLRSEASAVQQRLSAMQHGTTTSLLIGSDIERGLIARVSDAPTRHLPEL